HAFNPFDVKFKYKDIYRIIKDVKNSDFFNYTVKGNIGFNLGRFGNYDLAFNHTDKFPVIKIKLKVSNFKVGNPKVKLALANPPDNFPGISLRNLRKKVNQSVNPQFTVDVNYDLTFINQSKAPISFSDLVYEFNIDGNNIAKGNSGKPISYNGKTAIFRFKNTLNLTGVLKSLFAKKRAGYTLKGSFNLNLPIFGRRNIPFSVKGNLNW
ncbi:MAG: LEA type 2 family protein, partial [Spirochaetota bacterium]|nr:LEA type 2 family protein [Spirochaetota bacterium]